MKFISRFRNIWKILDFIRSAIQHFVAENDLFLTEFTLNHLVCYSAFKYLLVESQHFSMPEAGCFSSVQNLMVGLWILINLILFKWYFIATPEQPLRGAGS